MQAGADKRESERELKLKETIANLQSTMPGKYQRSFDDVSHDVIYSFPLNQAKSLAV